MFDKFITIFTLLFDKVTSWKDVIKIIFILILVFLFQFFLSRSVQPSTIIETKTVLEQNDIDSLLNVVACKHDELINKTLNHSPETNKTINNILDNINDRNSFNRSIIMLYHNNITMTNGVPYMRMSISHERINEHKFKVKSEIIEFQNVPSSVFAFINEELMKTGFICYNVDELREVDLNTHIRLINDSATGVIGIIMKNDNGTPIGTLFCYSYDKKMNCSNETIEQLRIYSETISEMLKY